MKKTDNVLTLKLGQRIKQLRINKNLSQEDLALICDLHRTYIGSCERGERNITIQNVNKICMALNISMKEFFSCFE
ncbi:helix-turn-helix domain-containing protein [Dickeya zeae]|uniref:Helix-turn-helix transcriptional regulator n=1 Tax=Dickeya zeae TaxID=204042 RepID=A0ABX8W1G4_9GAMM|nr:helix-turn-helix transcriptional regulator [Dickeya zeae]QYM93333.1 helix-turn-helix transcriptional regulator [Dickeya zeae]